MTVLFGIWSVTLKGKKRFALLLTAFSAAPALMCQSDLPLLSGRNRRLSILAQQVLFSLYMVSFLFPPPPCLLVFPSFCPPFLPSPLPAFLHPTNICDMPSVYVHDKGTIKEVSWEQIHQLEFTKNRWSPSKKFKRTACFSLGWFLRQNLKVPDSQISKTQ